MADETKRFIIEVESGSADQQLRALVDAEQGVNVATEELDSTFSKFVAALGGPVTVTIGAVVAGIGALSAATLELAERGDALNGVAQGFADLGGNSEAIDRATESSKGLISELDLLQAANKAILTGIPNVNENFELMAEFSVKLGESLNIGPTDALQRLTQAIATGRPIALQQLGIFVDTDKAVEDYAKSLGVSVKAIDESTKKQIAQKAALDAVFARNKELSAVTLGLSDTTGAFTTRIGDLITRLGAAIDSNKTFTAILEKLLGLIGNVAEKLINALVSAIEAVDREVRLLIDGWATLSKIWEQMTSGEIPDLGRAIKDVQTDMLQLSIEQKKAEKAHHDAIAPVAELSVKYNALGESASKAASELEKVSKIEPPTIVSAEWAPSPTTSGGGAFGLDFGSAMADSISHSVEGAIANAISVALSGGHTEDYRAVAGDLGSEIGNAIGGPIGGVVGEFLSTAVFDAFDHAFGGGRDPENNARKGVDRFFAEVFNKDRLTVIVNDQLSFIDDLDFGGSHGFDGGAGFAVFEGMADSAVSAFGSIGVAFAELLGVTEDIGAQIGAVFANNLGGDLNNLQLLIQASGASAEDLKGAIVDAFLAGELAATEAAVAIANVNEVMTDGIPGAVGAVDKAFDNLVASAGRGRAAVDAVKDIFFEAKEVGVDSFEELREHLINLGYSVEEVDKFFAALNAAGIDTFEEAISASVETIISALANLENTGFSFAEFTESAGDEIDELNDKISRIPKEIVSDYVINVRYDGEPLPSDVPTIQHGEGN